MTRTAIRLVFGVAPTAVGAHDPGWALTKKGRTRSDQGASPGVPAEWVSVLAGTFAWSGLVFRSHLFATAPTRPKPPARADDSDDSGRPARPHRRSAGPGPGPGPGTRTNPEDPARPRRVITGGESNPRPRPGGPPAVPWIRCPSSMGSGRRGRCGLLSGPRFRVGWGPVGPRGDPAAYNPGAPPLSALPR
jgi:hypothetical protein